MESSRGDDLVLLEYWAILVRRRWAIYLSVVALTLFALIGSFLTTPYYRSTATLQIERLNPDVLAIRDVAQIDYSWTAYTDFYQTQYEIISSRGVAEKAVKDGHLVDHPRFAEELTTAGSGLLNRLMSLVPSRSTPRVEPDLQELAAGLVQDRLSVVPIRNSHLVRVSWVDPDPALATLVANAVAKAYVKFSSEARFSTSEAAEDFLVTQIADLKGDIGEIEERLLQYGEAKGILSIGDANNITLQALEDIAQKKTAAQTRLAEAEARYQSVREVSVDALPEVMESALIARLREENAGLETEYSEKARLFKGDWPGMQTLESKREQSRARLEYEIQHVAGQVRASAEAAYLEARAEVRSYEALLLRQEKAAQTVKRDAIEYATLQSEVQEKRQTLDAMIGRQNEMALTSRLSQAGESPTNIHVIEEARPPTGPYKPRTLFNILLGIVLGSGLGVGLALLLDHLDNTINTPDDVTRIVPLPVLAMIPRHGEKGGAMLLARQRQLAAAPPTFDLITHLDGQAVASEAYRELRTSILLSYPGSPPQKIAITSASPEEGKTATTVNLAIALAQMGRRVVMVDTDLRRPRLHEVFSVDNAQGVTNYLSGLVKQTDKLVVRTPISTLDLMPSGPIAPNPSELLNSPVFAQLAEELLRQGYDHVIFDSPPVMAVSDPVIIATLVDSAILVARAGRTTRQALSLAAEKLVKSKLAHIGVVLNDVDLESAGSPYYYYRHYSGHSDLAPDSDDDANQPTDATA